MTRDNVLYLVIGALAIAVVLSLSALRGQAAADWRSHQSRREGSFTRERVGPCIEAPQVSGSASQITALFSANGVCYYSSFDQEMRDIVVKHHRVESPKRIGRRRGDAVQIERQIVLRAGERLYSSIQATLERDHYGSYVMFNTRTAEYVLGPTLSQTHADFIERFGKDTPGWATRIGISIFATI